MSSAAHWTTQRYLSPSRSDPRSDGDPGAVLAPRRYQRHSGVRPTSAPTGRGVEIRVSRDVLDGLLGPLQRLPVRPTDAQLHAIAVHGQLAAHGGSSSSQRQQQQLRQQLVCWWRQPRGVLPEIANARLVSRRPDNAPSRKSSACRTGGVCYSGLFSRASKVFGNRRSECRRRGWGLSDRISYRRILGAYTLRRLTECSYRALDIKGQELVCGIRLECACGVIRRWTQEQNWPAIEVLSSLTDNDIRSAIW